MRVLLLTDDLLFGSRLQAALAEHETSIGTVPADDFDLIVADLTNGAAERIATLSALGTRRPRTLAFYSHVDVDTRTLAQQAGLELVVPRSRIAREAAELVARLGE